jgi:hypothetical protein
MIGSQSLQDRFALEICKNKTYLEIGANDPKKCSNTFLLEETGFVGFSIELDMIWKKRWDKSSRKNKIYWDNALTFDYLDAIKKNNLTKNIGYLSCDIEPPYNTFNALKTLIELGIVFECITFEHDLYQYSEIDYNQRAIEFLTDCGYKVAVTDVCVGDTEDYFETWFVKDNIDFEQITYKEWKSKFNKN